MPKFDKVLLASDFDNTLVYTQGALEAGSSDVPPMCARNREALEYFIANGGLFSVSTGRALPAFVNYVDTVPHNAPCILANGAAIYDFRAERYLVTAFIPEAVRGHMAQLLEAFPRLSFEVYHDDRRIHCMNPNAYTTAHQHLTRTPAEIAQSFDEIDLPFIKILFEEDNAVLDAVCDFIHAQAWADDYELIYSNSHLLELTARGATKGKMVLRLADMLGVAREDIYCIGDHKNDIPMLEVSAIPFAPANCVPEVREAGAQILCHCADGAIADVIDILDKRYK